MALAIFGITEVPTDGADFDSPDFPYAAAEEGKATPGTAAAAIVPSYEPPSPPQAGNPAVEPEPSPEAEPVAAEEAKKKEEDEIDGLD